ncbi:MAG: DUF4253 domain-containing protein [Alphaproteobacteria bacterium]|nr:DUF4253 domain-containing protein [Alphaproteobacteria bacterium]
MAIQMHPPGKLGGKYETEIPFHHASAPGKDAKNALDWMASNYRDMTPVMMGSPYNVRVWKEIQSQGHLAPSEWIARSKDFDLDNWFIGQRNQYQPARGVWSEATPKKHLSGDMDMDCPDDFLMEVIIVLLPTDNDTQWAAYLGHDAWGTAPDPRVHIGLSQKWNLEFGATIKTFRQDSFNLSVEWAVQRPISTVDEAIEVAFEQYYYSRVMLDKDYGLGGRRSIESLASRLVGSTVWEIYWNNSDSDEPPLKGPLLPTYRQPHS